MPSRQDLRNLLTYAREWLRLHAIAMFIALVLGLLAGKALAADAPTVTLSVPVGAGNVPTATWSAQGATDCTASGGWSGTKAASGTQALPAISVTTTYNLGCSWPADTSARLSWTAPTQYTDGTALPSGDLAAYRIYHGTSASNLTLHATVPAPALTYTHTGLSTGTHYWAASAVVQSGAESARSATVSKAIAAAQTASASVRVAIPGAPTLTVQQTVAYDVKLTGFKYALGKAIGTVPLGTECHTDFALPDGYYRVERDAVTVTAKNTRSAVFVARCG